MTENDDAEPVYCCSYPGCDEDLIRTSVLAPDAGSRFTQRVPTWACPQGHPQGLVYRRRTHH